MILTLVQNTALLIALSVLWGLILAMRKNYPYSYRIATGLLFGLSAIAAMMMPLRYEEGIFYDGRSIVIALSGLYGGGIASLIASIIGGAYRINAGGVGVYVGVASIIVSAVAGLLFRRLYNNQPTAMPWYMAAIFAFVTHVLVLLCQLLLPWPKGLEVLAVIGLPFLIILSSGLWAIALSFNAIEERTLALQDLKADVGSLQNVLTVNPSVVFTMSLPQRTVSWISPNVQMVLGYSTDEATAPGWFEQWIYDDDRPRYNSLFSMLEGKDLASAECRMFDAFKTLRWVDIQLRAIRSESGETGSIVGSINDVTLHKIMVQELAESEERYSAVFKNSIAVMLLIDPNDGTIVDANDAAVQFYGWPLKQLRSMKISDINTLSAGVLKELMEEARISKRVHFEFQHRKNDGAVCDVDVYSSAVIFKGKQYLFSIIHDVTAKRQAQAALKKSEELFRLIFDNAPIGIYAFDDKGVVTACNEHFVSLIGSSRAALVGLDTLQLPDKRVVDSITRCLRGQQVEFRDWYSSVTADKTTFARALFSPLIIENTVIGGLAIVEDMTPLIESEKQKEKLEEQFRQSQKMEAIGRLAGGIAHDFNNMLSIISGYTELIKLKIDKEHAVYLDAEEIANAAKRSAEIVRQLLLFTRQQKVHPIRVNPHHLINANKKMLAAMVGENITIRLELSPDVYDIWVDAAMFVQILTNLASNARDAIKDVGLIQIVTKNIQLDSSFCQMHPGSQPGEYALMQFIDNGVGMNKSTVERIFEPFFTTKKVGKGTGLGMSTVYGIVKQFKGYINVYSEPGKGSVINVYLPKYQEVLADSEIIQESRIYDTPLGKHNIVFVEDDVAISGMIQKMLALLNQETIVFNDPLEALYAVDDFKDRVTILMTDLIMPKMNGLELYNAFKIRMPHLKVIYISGYSDEVVRGMVLADGQSYFLQKPFTLDDLRDVLIRLS